MDPRRWGNELPLNFAMLRLPAPDSPAAPSSQSEDFGSAIREARQARSSPRARSHLCTTFAV
jgi:hypothetical protein